MERLVARSRRPYGQCRGNDRVRCSD